MKAIGKDFLKRAPAWSQAFNPHSCSDKGLTWCLCIIRRIVKCVNLWVPLTANSHLQSPTGSAWYPLAPGFWLLPNSLPRSHWIMPCMNKSISLAPHQASFRRAKKSTFRIRNSKCYRAKSSNLWYLVQVCQSGRIDTARSREKSILISTYSPKATHSCKNAYIFKAL